MAVLITCQGQTLELDVSMTYESSSDLEPFGDQEVRTGIGERLVFSPRNYLIRQVVVLTNLTEEQYKLYCSFLSNVIRFRLNSFSITHPLGSFSNCQYLDNSNQIKRSVSGFYTVTMEFQCLT